MHICIDSCVFIRGLQNATSDAAQLLTRIGPSLHVIIPRFVAVEVTRNLRFASDVSNFYRLFHEQSFAHIVDEPVPPVLYHRYVELGLRAKGDAYIGAFAEWMRVNYLISDNRHFLREVRIDAYQLLTPGDLLGLLDKRK